MKKGVRLPILGLCFAVWISLLANGAVSAKRQAVENKKAVTFFEVLDLPARIDEPKLLKVGERYVLKCALANRSNEQLLGVRLVLLVVDHDGKLRGRITWNEEADIADYSIKTFEFSPAIKTELQTNDRLFLGLDEVTGRETIWHVPDGEKALRAYSSGQHDVVPKVQTVANKADPGRVPVVIPLEKR